MGILIIIVWILGIVASFTYFTLCNKGKIKPNNFYKTLAFSIYKEDIYDAKLALFLSGAWPISWTSYIMINEYEKRSSRKKV